MQTSKNHMTKLASLTHRLNKYSKSDENCLLQRTDQQNFQCFYLAATESQRFGQQFQHWKSIKLISAQLISNQVFVALLH